MKAVRWHGRDDVRLDDVPEPVPARGEVVVRVAFCGICGSDLHEYLYGPLYIPKMPHPLTGAVAPVTLGHEFSGRAVAVGSDVTGVTIGDRVTVNPCLLCGERPGCRQARPNYCAKLGSVGLTLDGGLAPLVKVPAYGCHRLPPEVNDEQGAWLEPLAVRRPRLPARPGAPSGRPGGSTSSSGRTGSGIPRSVRRPSWGAAIGAALNGLRPVAEVMFMDFIATCWDQVVNQMAKMRYMFGGQVRLPLVIRTHVGAGLSVGPRHSGSYEAWAAHVPGLKVVMPSTPADAKGLLKAAIRDDNPVLVVENKTLYAMKGEVPVGEHLVPIGRAEVKREGRDVTVVALSRMVHEALKAAEGLAAEGISVEVLDPRTLSPLDRETLLASVGKTGRLVVIHEAWAPCGVGTEIAALVAEHGFRSLKAPIRRVTPSFTPAPFSPPMEKFWLPGTHRIAGAVREVLT